MSELFNNVDVYECLPNRKQYVLSVQNPPKKDAWQLTMIEIVVLVKNHAESV